MDLILTREKVWSGKQYLELIRCVIINFIFSSVVNKMTEDFEKCGEGFKHLDLSLPPALDPAPSSAIGEETENERGQVTSVSPHNSSAAL